MKSPEELKEICAELQRQNKILEEIIYTKTKLASLVRSLGEFD